MTEEAARQCAKDRKQWRTLVHVTYVTELVSRGIFAWHCVLSDRPPVVITWRGVNAVT